MLFSVILDALIASVLAFAIVNTLLFAFGNVFLKKGRALLSLKEIRKEIRNIISEEKE